MEEARFLSIPTIKELTEARFADTAAMREYFYACGFVDEDFEEMRFGNLRFAADCAYSKFFPGALGVMDKAGWRLGQDTLEIIDRVVING
jgi:hypothetical protein